MPDTDLSKKSIDDLVRDLGDDDVAVREQAERELKRRTLDDSGLDDELRRLLPGIRDPEVDARLHEILNRCRFYIRICSVVAFPRNDWWEGDVEFRFGTSSSGIEVSTATYHLEAGEPKDLGPGGVQIYNSVQHKGMLDCGDAIDHHVYAEVPGLASGSQRVRHRCLDGKRHIFWVEAAGKRLRFMFKCELETHCSATPPWSTPCESGKP